MIVDDQTDLLKILKLGLRSRGHAVATAGSADEALARLATHSSDIDIVLTDYAMPGMDGLMFLKEIREKHKNLDVIMMTAYGEKKLAVEALKNRCAGFIEKPFRLDKLIEEVDRVRANRNIENAHAEHDLWIPFFVHQINNPLTRILGSAELALFDDHSPEKLKKRLLDIKAATQSIKQINNKILKLGKGRDRGDGRINPKNILDGCLDSLKNVLELKGISVNKRYSSSIPEIRGNRFGLEQVIHNLILNAVDAMEVSAVKCLHVCISENARKRTISMTFKDSGCGMSETEKEKIFSSYFTTKAEGTGLGLAVVKEIVDSHHGKIDLHSEVGKGSRFIVTLPTGTG